MISIEELEQILEENIVHYDKGQECEWLLVYILNKINYYGYDLSSFENTKIGKRQNKC
jgi:hypothetical protein